jgi:hypothetical protein
VITIDLGDDGDLASAQEQSAPAGVDHQFGSLFFAIPSSGYRCQSVPYERAFPSAPQVATTFIRRDDQRGKETAAFTKMTASVSQVSSTGMTVCVHSLVAATADVFVSLNWIASPPTPTAALASGVARFAARPAYLSTVCKRVAFPLRVGVEFHDGLVSSVVAPDGSAGGRTSSLSEWTQNARRSSFELCISEMSPASSGSSLEGAQVAWLAAAVSTGPDIESGRVGIPTSRGRSCSRVAYSAQHDSIAPTVIVGVEYQGVKQNSPEDTLAASAWIEQQRKDGFLFCFERMYDPGATSSAQEGGHTAAVAWLAVR